MNLADVPYLGKSGNALLHDHSLILTVINLLDCNRLSGPSVNNTLIGFNRYSNTLAVKDGPKLPYMSIYLTLDIQGKVRKVKLVTQLRFMYFQVEKDKKCGSTGLLRSGAGCSNFRSKGPPSTLCKR